MRLIKIIKHGFLNQKNNIYTLQCPRCSCIFKYNLEERDISPSDYSFGNVFINCPECKKEIRLFLNELINGDYDVNI